MCIEWADRPALIINALRLIVKHADSILMHCSTFLALLIPNLSLDLFSSSIFRIVSFDYGMYAFHRLK